MKLLSSAAQLVHATRCFAMASNLVGLREAEAEGIRAVDALALQGDGLAKEGLGFGLRHLDTNRLDLDEHLVVLAVGLAASVLLVLAATVAAAVVEDGDHGGLPGKRPCRPSI